MKFRNLVFMFGLVFTTLAFADPLPDDIAAIKKLSGCYDVTFEFHDTKALAKGYKRSHDHKSGVSELIFVDEDSPNRIVLQHVLVMDEQAWNHLEGSLQELMGRYKAMIEQMGGPSQLNGFKHWSQIWTFEPERIWSFQGNRRWIAQELSGSQRKGSWSQQVRQVDDSPRYDCAAPWIHGSKGPSWRCEAPAPLPRRETDQRNDYQILLRSNHNLFDPSGWIHDQENVKIALSGSTQKRLAEEKGRNTYVRRPEGDEGCAKAEAWWSEYRPVWHAIQAAWTKVYENESELNLQPEVRSNTLDAHLIGLAYRAKLAAMPLDSVQGEASKIIEEFMIRE